MSNGRSREDAAREAAADARARLDQMREEAGMPLRGDEIAQRAGGETPIGEDPPLDWRLTPRNVALQIGAVALFAGVVWFLAMLVYDSVAALFAHYGG
ncbi:MAG: hypothetical protein AAGM38_17235 [Pseudomonadota bacterium]